MQLLSMQDFGSPSLDDLAVVGFITGTLHYCSRSKLEDEMQPFSKYLREYPQVSITPDILTARETARTTHAGDLFLPVCDNMFRKLASIWREKGFAGAVRLAATADPQQITTPLHWMATRITWVLDFVDRGIYQKDTLPISGSGSVTDIVRTRDWNTSLIRCISWHPHCARLAVVTRDDRIRIFSQGTRGIPILRHGAQKSICNISWRPLASRELAVACQTGILIWTIELGAASNYLSHAVLLKQRNHAPVTSVTWHPQGQILVSCSPADINMLIWDISKREYIPLKRVDGGGLCFTRWSSCGSRLFAATCRGVFRVWNTGTATPWYVDKWTIPSGRVAVACFGPQLTLLFASDDDPGTIFSLPLQETIFDVKKSPLDDTQIALPLIDLTKVNFASEDSDEYVSVGGRIVAMEWNSTGKYLAILFQDSPLVALVKTKLGLLSRVVEAVPGCLVKGFPGEVPNCINFYQKSTNTSIICLSIAWSSGRIQHFPIVENEASADVTTGNTSRLSQSFSIQNETYTLDFTHYR